MSREEEIRQELFDHTLNGHAPEVKALTEEGLKLGMDPMDILFKALIPSLEEVGRRFEKGDFFVPEMLIAARAMQGALVILRPLIGEPIFRSWPSRPTRFSNRAAFGWIETPAPISLRTSACSNTVTSRHLARSASAAVRPPIPPPTIAMSAL